MKGQPVPGRGGWLLLRLRERPGIADGGDMRRQQSPDGMSVEQSAAFRPEGFAVDRELPVTLMVTVLMK